jgi:rare lipoprotein A
VPPPGRRPLAGVVACAVLLSACASGPRRDGQAGSAPARTTAERSPAPSRSPDRDGAPAVPPADLALLPDPTPQVEPIKPGGANKPYVVLGQSYEPQASDVSWKERGQASWYGTKFHGRRTASGEVFSMYGLTAAHRTLPIPSYVRVRHVGTGKEIIVRVNDRGPFHSARVLDLSYAAATKLGIVSMGSAQVEIERLTFDEIRTGAWRRGVLPDGPDQGDVVAASPLDARAPAGAAGGSLMPAVAGASPVLAPSELDAASATPAPASALSTAQPAGVSGSMDAAASSASPPAAGGVGAAGIQQGQGRAYTTAAKGFWVQLAALGKLDGVDKLQQRVATELSTLQPMLAVFHESPYFKLQMGPYGSKDQALAAAQQARQTLQLTPLVIERR